MTKPVDRNILIDSFGLQTFQLDNGLTVYFTYNPLEPKIYVATVIKAGARHGPKENTGLAHYLEHLLFKGTESIGAANWPKEKPLYQKIISLYDQRFTETDPNKKTLLSNEINKLSVEAAQYYNSMEITQLFQQIGGQQVNAHTTYDYTSFHLEIPKNRFHEWAMIESERYRRPVFRGFQWELETVYEELNQRKEDLSSRALESILASIFPGHPYGERTILGKEEHLKNPSIQPVIDFFNTYYVPSNMAIIVSGDIPFEEVKTSIENQFGRWEEKPLPPPNSVAIRSLGETKRLVLKSQEQPYLQMAFQGPNYHHNDYSIFKIIMEILESKAGPIETNLLNTHKVLAASSGLVGFQDATIAILTAHPNQGQSNEELEALLMEQIELLADGQFDHALVEGIRLNQMTGILSEIESNSKRVELIRNAYSSQISWSSYSKKLLPPAGSISNEDISRVVTKYFKSPKVVVTVEDGSPEFIEIPKPDIDAQIFATDYRSQLGLDIDRRNPTPINTKFLDLNKDIEIFEPREGMTVYRSKNPIHNLGRITLKFHIGSLDLPDLNYWDFYREYYCEDLSSKLFFQGITHSSAVGLTSWSVSISGPEENLSESLKQFLDCFHQLDFDRNTHDQLTAKMEEVEQILAKDPTTINEAVIEKITKNEMSGFLTWPSHNKIREYTEKDLQNTKGQILASPLSVFYVGNFDKSSIEELMISLLPDKSSRKKASRTPYSFAFQNIESKIYFYHVPDLQQASIYGLIELQDFPPDQYRTILLGQIFSSYFGVSTLNNLMHRELREKGGLAYSTSGSFDISGDHIGYTAGDKSRFQMSLGTQFDKTADAINKLRTLIGSIPYEEDLLRENIVAAKMAKESYRYPFRSIPAIVAHFGDVGLLDDSLVDPMERIYEELKQTKPHDLYQFATELIKDHPTIWVVIGDRSKISPQALSDSLNLKVEEMKAEDIFGFLKAE